MTELVKLRQQQQDTRAHLQSMEERLQGTEQKQQQMMTFLARAVQNPTFIQQLVLQKEKRKELEAMTKKRRRPVHKLRGSIAGKSSQSHGQEPQFSKIEASDFSGSYGYEVSELETLALEIQGLGRTQEDEVEEPQEQESEVRELNYDFWEELLGEKFEYEKGPSDVEGREDEDVNVLTERLGYLGSSPK